MSVEALWPLWLLLVLPLLWVFTWRHRRRHAPRRLLAASALRSLVLCLLAVALMRPALLHPVAAVSVVYALDVSHSIRPEDIESALRWIDTANVRHRPAQARIVTFADRARLLNTTAHVRALTLATEGDGDGTALDQSATDLEQALRLALYGFAPGHAKRLVLLSDGNANQGNVWNALPALRQAGVRLYPVPLASAAVDDAWVEAIDAPAYVRAREPVTVDVRVMAHSAMHAYVELRQGDDAPLRREITLAAGSNRLSFELRFARTGSVELKASVSAAGDRIVRNDTLTASVWVERPVNVLYVEGGGGAVRHLQEALQVQGMTVQTVDPAALAAGGRTLADIDVVVLSDLPPTRMDDVVAQRLERYVRDAGGGLVFAAGENTYGRDGFSGSAIERLLPVTFEGKRKRRELDLVLLIDRSHSMRGRKLELAKSAALATLDLLQAEHRLGVIAFDARPHEIVALATVGNKRRAEDAIAAMTASGQTNLYNALLQAQRMLADSSAQTRHVILLSDGVTASPPSGTTVSSSAQVQAVLLRLREETARREGGVTEGAAAPAAEPTMEGFVAFAEELAANKVTLSTVAIGDKPNLTLLRALAEVAQGKHYVARNDSEIPGLFVAEARRLLGGSIVETTFQALPRARSPLIAGVDFVGAPPLHGFVAARAKRVAEVLLVAPQEQPLLVQTQYGLGRTVAFLSDVKNRWAAQWLDWSGYGRMWAQVVRAVARPVFDGMQWRVERQQREAQLTLIARDEDGFRTTLSPQVHMTAPDGSVRMLTLRQTAPGVYDARVHLAVARQAPYRFRLLPGGGIGEHDSARLGERALHFAYSDEYRTLPPDTALLERLSVETGGRPGADGTHIFDPGRDGGTRRIALWPWCLGAALLLFMLEIAVRRMPWPLRARPTRPASVSHVTHPAR